MSTTTRALLAFLVVITVAFYFLMNKLADRVERQYLEAAEEPMVDTAHLLAAYLEQELTSGNLKFDKLRRAFDDLHRSRIKARIYSIIKTGINIEAYVTDANGRVLFDSRNGLAEGEDYSRYHDVSRTLRGEYGARSTRTNESDELSSIMHVGAPIRNGGQIVGMVSLSKPQASMFGFIGETRERIWWYGWTVLLVAALLTVLLSHWFLRPIRRLTDYARAVRSGQRIAFPALAGPDVQMLGHALEEMRDSLENRKYVESYVQSLTHEMKSPLAAIRGAVELLQEQSMPASKRGLFLGNIQAETARLQNTVDRLLALAVIETRKSLENATEVSLNELLDALCATHGHSFVSRGIQVRRTCDGDPVVRGESFLLEMALGNMLQNAIDFSPQGGSINVILRRGANAGTVEIAIEDEGPGIPDYALGKVFDRFYSLPHPATGRKSSGLGLCFVREAADLHGGTASLTNRPDRTGARSVLILPAEV